MNKKNDKIFNPVRNEFLSGANGVKMLKKIALKKGLNFKDLLLSGLVVLLSLPTVYIVARAGSLTPTASPAATMHSLLEMAAKDAGDTFDRATTAWKR